MTAYTHKGILSIMPKAMQPTPKIAEVIGAKLRELRDSQPAITQAELAEEIGIPLMVLNRALRGVSTPAADALIKIAIYYNITTDELLAVDKARKQAKKKKRRAAS